MLSQQDLTIQSPDREEKIPYGSVRSVKLSRRNAGRYGMQISFDSHRSVLITNMYYLASGEFEDRSRQYTAFVRILHQHLRLKSSAVYSSGNSFSLLLIWSLLSAFFSFLISFVSEYLGLSLINPFMQALILAMVVVVIIFFLNRGALPGKYSPDEIPVQFLP